MTAMEAANAGTLLKARSMVSRSSGTCCPAITSRLTANAKVASTNDSRRVISRPRRRNPPRRGKASRSFGIAVDISSSRSVIYAERDTDKPGQRVVLGLLRTRVNLWHLEFFPASHLLVRWNILDMCGNPPNVAAGVFDAPISFTGRQRHHRKNRNSAEVERALIDGVTIGYIQINGTAHHA